MGIRTDDGIRTGDPGSIAVVKKAFGMNSEQWNVESQLRQLQELQGMALEAQQRVSGIHRELQEIDDREADALEKLRQENDAQLGRQLDRVRREWDERNRTVVQNYEEHHAQRADSLSDRLQRLERLQIESVSAVRTRLQHELWVLQSVCDEHQEDTPVWSSERAQGEFQTQLKWLQQRFAELDERVRMSSEYLRVCHAGMESTLPPPVAEAKSRDAARGTAAEFADRALVAAMAIDRPSLPQWIAGGRIFGLGILIFLIVSVFATIARADIALFLNPAAGQPDWQWLGVSCGIGIGTAVLIVMVLLSLVQSRLRGAFEEMLQCVSNAKALAEFWELRSRVELKKLELAAEKWSAEVLLRREQHRLALSQAAETEIQQLMEDFEHTVDDEKQACDRELASLAQEHDRQRHQAEESQTQEIAAIRLRQRDDFQKSMRAVLDQHRSRRHTLTVELSTVIAHWKNGLASARVLTSVSRDRAAIFPGWDRMRDSHWRVPAELPDVLPAGLLTAEFPDVPDKDLMDQEPLCFRVPALLRFPQDMSICVQHDASGREPALDFIRALLLRLLTSILPGRVQFTLIDPVGLGQSFSAMMHLADFDELLISNRIWTDSVQIRDRLQKVTEHMESVFQTYLRSEFETIEDYNRAAGEVAEPYHFVVVAGFPTGFTEEASRHLTSILTSGPRCGVHAIIAWSPEQSLPRSFDPENLRSCCRQFRVQNGRVVPETGQIEPRRAIPGEPGLLETDAAFGKSSPATIVNVAGPKFDVATAPDASTYVSLVRMVGEQSRDARRVEVSFSRIAPRAEVVWSLSTADGLDLPIGRAGAARLQYLRLGRGTSQHVLIAGKTGSGKSTLMHILVTNLALYYSPREIEFYLIDFKKGVEFRTYADCGLPHARVIAIESDREFGLSVLERLDEILQQRGDLFRSRGVQDVPAFRRMCPDEAMPRLLLLIDEFQEFFTSEDRVSSRAALLLDRLIRQGRAFGIHVVLGSQTLGGAYSLARSTLGQVAVRIALQCSESDAHLILSEDNSAARLLTRPGEAIYNDANGMVEGNHPFQIAWLDEEKREALLGPLQFRADLPKTRPERMIVFEGNVSPLIEDCRAILNWAQALSKGDASDESGIPVWIGDPVAIAEPVRIEFRRSGGQNLLIVGQEGDTADAMIASAAVSCQLLRKTTGRNSASELILLHDGRDRASWQRFSASTFCGAQFGFQLREAVDVDVVLEEVWNRMTTREAVSDADDTSQIFLAIRNLGQFRSLRRDEDDFGLGSFGASKEITTATRLSDLIKKGPLVGIHVLIWSDTFSNALRWLSTSLLREFDSRIAFRLNQTDSASLIDTPAAASLTQGRAILYRDQTGTADRFRPFGWPSEAWLQSVTTGSAMSSEAAVRLPAAPVITDIPVSEDLDIDQLIIE